MAEPHVRVEPGVRFGYPHVRGIATDMVAGQVWAGLSVAEVGADYGLTRDEVLVACWYEARHVRPRTGARSGWQQWATAAEANMWHGDHAAVADPPCRREVHHRG